MQPLTINATKGSSLLTLTLGYGTASDLHAAFRAGHVPHRNGNILAQTISVGGWSVQQHYRYDQLNRLSIVSEKAAPGGSAPNFSCPTSGTGVWRREYGYDRYGNRAATGTLQLASATPASTSVYVSSSNRLIGTWATYDAAGNLTAFKNPGGTSHGRWTASYDGENKQRYYCAAVTTPCTAAVHDVEYVYDGEGNRVLKEVTNGAATTYVYDAFGRLAAEYKLGGPTQEAGTFYRTTDHLGSTRLVTDSSGAVVSRRDFFPFGEQIDADASSGRAGLAGYNAPIGFPQLFTAKERDGESGLDYFLARYYSGAQRRFTSPDSAADTEMFVPLPYAELEAPQSLNLYAYAGNSPLRYVDIDGHDYRVCVDNGSGGQNCQNLNDKQYRELYDQQNGKQGIGLPNGLGGDIRCGGSTCGSVTYFETGIQDATFGLAVGYFGGKATGFVASKFFGAVGRFFGRTGGSAAGEAAGSSAGNLILGNGSKQAAREIIEALPAGAQKASAKRFVAGATSKETISITQSADGSLVLARTRPGFDGFQTFTKTIDSAGNSTTVQTARNAAGELVHYDPKP